MALPRLGHGDPDARRVAAAYTDNVFDSKYSDISMLRAAESVSVGGIFSALYAVGGIFLVLVNGAVEPNEWAYLALYLLAIVASAVAIRYRRTRSEKAVRQTGEFLAVVAAAAAVIWLLRLILVHVCIFSPSSIEALCQEDLAWELAGVMLGTLITMVFVQVASSAGSVTLAIAAFRSQKKSQWGGTQTGGARVPSEVTLNNIFDRKYDDQSIVRAATSVRTMASFVFVLCVFSIILVTTNASIAPYEWSYIAVHAFYAVAAVVAATYRGARSDAYESGMGWFLLAMSAFATLYFLWRLVSIYFCLILDDGGACEDGVWEVAGFFVQLLVLFGWSQMYGLSAEVHVAIRAIRQTIGLGSHSRSGTASGSGTGSRSGSGLLGAQPQVTSGAVEDTGGFWGVTSAPPASGPFDQVPGSGDAGPRIARGTPRRRRVHARDGTSVCR